MNSGTRLKRDPPDLRFVADASYQLRAPLITLRLRLKNPQSRLSGAEAAELNIAIDETERLATVVSDLLQLGRADQNLPALPDDS